MLLAASPYHTYQLQAARAVTGPWTNLASMAAPLAGVGQFTETNAPDAQRFYRSLAQPAITGSNTVLADFEGATYGAWVATGTAFGLGPAQGTLPSQGTVSGYQGVGLVNSFHNLDAATGTLTSPPFTITVTTSTSSLAVGNHPGQTCLNLLVNGVAVRTATGANSDVLAPAQWNVSAYLGQTAVLQIVDSATGPLGLHSWTRLSSPTSRSRPRPPLPPAPSWSPTSISTCRLRPGSTMRELTLSVGGQTVRQFDIELADAQPDFWVFLDLTPYLGQSAVVSVNQLPSGSGALLAIDQANTITGATNLYQETLRPQFHFSSRRGWNNDANMMVYYKGEYHLCITSIIRYGWQLGKHDTGATRSARTCSHWQELAEGIYPHQYGDWVWSGSGAVDGRNTGGFKTGTNDVLVASYYSTEHGECIAYSNDGGLYVHRLREQSGGRPLRHRRDPHLFWYAPSNYWLMAVYDGGRRQWRGILLHAGFSTLDFPEQNLQRHV